MQFGALMRLRMVNGVCALIPEEGGGKENFSKCEGPFLGKQPCSSYDKATTIVSSYGRAQRDSYVPARPHFTFPTLRFLK